MTARFLLHATACAALAACGGAPRAASAPTTVELAPAGPAASASAAAPEAAPVSKKEQEELAALGALGGNGASSGVLMLGTGYDGGDPQTPGPAGTSAAPLNGTGLAVGPGTPGPSIGVRLGAASVKGGAVANSSAVVAGMAAGFRRCLYEARTADPSGVKNGAKAEVVATIAAGGRVASAQLARTSDLSKAAIACIIARVSSAKFMPPDTGHATITPF